jgi:hypothetical protein
MQRSAKMIRHAIVLALLVGCNTAASLGATHRRAPLRAAVVQVAVTGKGDVRYIYLGHKIGDAELDRLCRDGIQRKSPVKFRKIGSGGDPMTLILVKAQCLGAAHTHATPPHKAMPPK